MQGLKTAKLIACGLLLAAGGVVHAGEPAAPEPIVPPAALLVAAASAPVMIASAPAATPTATPTAAAPSAGATSTASAAADVLPLLDPRWFAAPDLVADLPGHAVEALKAGLYRGPISWYGARFAGRPTANGERFDPAAKTMAHRELPFGTRVRITNPLNGRSIVVRVNDRGPFVEPRIADVSHAAAKALGFVRAGVVHAVLEVLGADESH